MPPPLAIHCIRVIGTQYGAVHNETRPGCRSGDADIGNAAITFAIDKVVIRTRDVGERLIAADILAGTTAHPRQALRQRYR
jgi:hypothetical protein